LASFRCRICGRSFKSLDEYERHWSKEHKEYEIKPLGERLWEEYKAEKDELSDKLSEVIVLSSALTPKKRKLRLDELILSYESEGGA